MKLPKVSIVVPVYNCEQYIDECISSLVNQSYIDFEIVVVNDGSTDHSLQLCEQWRNKDSRIKIITIPNGGVSNARNLGIQNAMGDYVLFVDADDIIHYHTLECMVEHVAENTIVAVSMERFQKNEELHHLDHIIDDCAVAEGKSGELVKCRHGYFSCGILYSRKLINKYKIEFHKDIPNLEDVVWNATYFMYVDQMVYLKYPFYKYRVNPTSITSKCGDTLWQARWQYIAYRAICSEYANRADKQFSKTTFKIKNTCIKAMCGELLTQKYGLKELEVYMQQECGVKLETNLTIRLQYWLLYVWYKLKGNS